MIFDGLGRSRLDVFEPLAIEAGGLPAGLLQAAAEICAVVARPYRAAALMARLRDLSVRPTLAEALIRVLPPQELAELAGELLEREEARALLAEVMPQDRWAREVVAGAGGLAAGPRAGGAGQCARLAGGR